jgi:hypothetical protein
MKDAPKCVVDTLATLRAERVPLASRVDAIDIAIDNLSRIWGLGGETQAAITFERRNIERRTKPGPKPKAATTAPVEGDSTDAQVRRDQILQAIGRSEVGLTIGEIKKQLPKIADKD